MSLLTAVVVAALAKSSVRLIAFRPDLPFPEAGQRREFKLDGVDPGIPFTEVIPSWNVAPADGAEVKIEIKARGEGFETKWYQMAVWSLDRPSERVSIKGQKDADGDVETDTLVLKKPAKSLDVRVTLVSSRESSPELASRLKLLTLAFSAPKNLAPSRKERSAAWGKMIDVPQRAQGNYPRGGVLCSPTSLSMLLWHYSNQLEIPSMNKDVPEVEANVWDPVYKGAGNWSFNVAYAGSFPGMQGYVSRFRGIEDCEKWIEAGIPVVCSVSLALLKGEPEAKDSGHLVVLIGFDENGDPIFNDPAHRDQVRRTYRREHFEKAWMYSNRTVYIVHPEGAGVPAGDGSAWLAK